MSAVLGLSNLHLAVSDVDRAVRFYVEVFGLEERYRADNGVVYLRMPGSAHHLALRHYSDAGDRVSRFGLTSDPADTDSLVSRVLSLGGSLLRRRSPGRECFEPQGIDGAGIDIEGPAWLSGGQEVPADLTTSGRCVGDSPAQPRDEALDVGGW